MPTEVSLTIRFTDKEAVAEWFGQARAAGVVDHCAGVRHKDALDSPRGRAGRGEYIVATDGAQDWLVTPRSYVKPELRWNEARTEAGYSCPRCSEWIPAHAGSCVCGLDTLTLVARPRA